MGFIWGLFIRNYVIKKGGYGQLRTRLFHAFSDSGFKIFCSVSAALRLWPELRDRKYWSWWTLILVSERNGVLRLVSVRNFYS